MEGRRGEEERGRGRGRERGEGRERETSCNDLFCIRFDSDLSVAKEDAATERQEKEKLARGKHTLKTDYEELQEKLKAAQEELEKSNQEKEDLQAELPSTDKCQYGI